MSGRGDPSVDALLAHARAQFAASLPGKVAALQDLVARGAWDDARRAAHKLRGSASTYGHPAVGACASVVEETLIAAPHPPDETTRARLAACLTEARAEAARAAVEAT